MNQPFQQHLSTLQLLLLDLTAPARTVTQAQVDTLSAQDWQTILKMARQHRLGPLLHWQMKQAHAHLTIPTECQAEWALSYKNATLRNLLLQRELLLVHQIFKNAAIPYVALKGAYLAYHAYPHPALRPMRDLDILVPKDQALKAYQILLDAGMSRIDAYQGTPELALSLHKHLPPLRSRSDQVNVELHSRLFHHESEGLPQPDLSDAPGFWNRISSAPIANQLISFEPPTELLLHMIVHAVYDHQFNNGPLLLSDLAFLLTTQAIDWPLFWSLAQQGQQTQGCLLALKLTQRYWGINHIEWPNAVTQKQVELDAPTDIAAFLMLREGADRRDVNLHLEILKSTSKTGILFSLLRRLFPSKDMIAENYLVRRDSWYIYLWYLVNLRHLLLRRIPGFWRAQHQQHFQQEVKELAKLRQWLAG
nr:nucleotidyltransferase family protein [uncultured Rhodoferax sp.]